MKTLNFKRIISIIAFVALAGFSCFWTAESLFIWQPSITIVGAWLIAVVFTSLHLFASLVLSKDSKDLAILDKDCLPVVEVICSLG